MATAACGAQTTSSACTGKLHKEHLRKSRDSRRRRAALLFLTNISLDGRPVLPINDAVAAGQGDIEFEGTNIGSIVTELSPASSSYPNLSSSASCGGVCPVPRLGILNVPPILVLPSDSEYGNVGSTELETTEQESGSISSQGNLLSPSSLQPTPLGQRKSPTLLSVQSCNSSLESRQRTRNLSGSSRPRSLKKVHFIKSMRQYDTRGSRIVLVCAKGSLCAAFSVLPYGESFHISDPALTNQRRRHSSGGISAALEMLPGLEGVELGMYGRTVSYAQFLYPTNVLVCEKPPEMALQMPYSRNSIPHSYPSSRLSSTVGLDLGHDLDRATHFAHHPVKGEALRQMDPAYLQPADPRVASHFVAADAGAHCLLPSVGVPYNSHDTVTYVDSCGPPGFPYRSAVGHVGVAVEAPTIRVIQRPEGVLLAGLAEVPSHQPSADMLTDKSSIGLDDNDYDPNLLSDPQWPCGKHKRVLIFASYMTTVIEYVKPSDLKKDMNETFKEKFPHIKLTLSKIRSLKREMHAAGEECGLQPGSVAMAFAYFEKLVLQGRLSKANRKLVAAACLLLAAKISSDLRKQEVKQLIDKLEEKFRISRRELISFEFTVLVALEMALYLPESKVMPHYRRLAQPASHP